MPRHIEEEIRANTPEAQGLADIAEGETARVTAAGEWICGGVPNGPGGIAGGTKAAPGKYPLPEANQNGLVIVETRADGQRKTAFNRDEDSLEFAGPCTLGFVCNDADDKLDENFGLITVSVDITP